MKDLTCAERIEKSFQDRISKLQINYKTGNFDKVEEPLSIDKKTIVQIQMSWGGPADWYEIELNDKNEVIGGKYIFQDWGDVSEKEIEIEDAEMIAEMYGITDF